MSTQKAQGKIVSGGPGRTGYKTGEDRITRDVTWTHDIIPGDSGFIVIATGATGPYKTRAAAEAAAKLMEGPLFILMPEES